MTHTRCHIVYYMRMDRILETAMTYLNNRDSLIYSYHGNTFLQGGELTDPDNGGRGRIDCSTLVHLAMAGTGFGDSPYVTGAAGKFFDALCPWYDTIITFRDLFLKYSDRSCDIRRAYGLARYCRENGLEIGQNDARRPGDLVFFDAPPSVYEEYVKYGAYLAVSHVGIVTADTDIMINATGRSDHMYNALHDPVQLTRIEDRGTPVITARMTF